MDDGANDWMKDAGLGWKTRFGLGILRGGVMQFFEKLVAGRPGLLRSVLAAYLVAIAVLYALGMQKEAGILAGLAGFIGITPANFNIPVSQEELTAFALAAIALVRAGLRLIPPFVAWIRSEK